MTKYIVVAVDDNSVGYMIEELQDKYPCVYVAAEYAGDDLEYLPEEQL
jgi:hypothetical protein